MVEQLLREPIQRAQLVVSEEDQMAVLPAEETVIWAAEEADLAVRALRQSVEHLDMAAAVAEPTQLELPLVMMEETVLMAAAEEELEEAVQLHVLQEPAVRVEDTVQVPVLVGQQVLAQVVPAVQATLE